MESLFNLYIGAAGTETENENDLGPYFRVISFEGREKISQMYSLKVVVEVTEFGELKELINRLLKERVFLEVNYGTAYRTFPGVVRKVSIIGRFQNSLHLELTIVPRIWFLKEIIRSEIFMNMTIPEIITQVLSKDTVIYGDISIDVSGINPENYDKKEYVTRYNESTLDFISRLMEEAGIYCYFKGVARDDTGGAMVKDSSVECLLFSDRKSVEKKLLPEIFRRGEGGKDDLYGLKSLSFDFSQVHKSVSVHSFDMDTSRTKKIMPKAESLVASSDIFEGVNVATVTRYASGLTSDNVSKVSDLNAEISAINAETVTGTGRHPEVRAGSIVSISTDYEDVKDFLLTEVVHRGRQSGSSFTYTDNPGRQAELNFYECDITGIPAETQYRNPVTVSKPKFYGFLPAIIEGQDGGTNAPFMDDLGRYKVKLCFDIEEKTLGHSSIWLKLMTPYGGHDPAFGMHFPLLKGTQVLIGFIGGDIDEPFIAGAIQDGGGSVVNNANVNLNVIRSATGNVLILGDGTSPGEEFIFMKNTNGYTTLGHVPDDLINKF
jgi:type VI secretion system VgrG family protein